MSEELFVRLKRPAAGKRPTAGEVYNEIIKPEQSTNPTARAFVDAGAFVTLVRESELTGVSPKDSTVLNNVLRVEPNDQAALPRIPGIARVGHTLREALAR